MRPINLELKFRHFIEETHLNMERIWFLWRSAQDAGQAVFLCVACN